MTRSTNTHLAELLAEREGIAISRPSLQRILRAAGLASPRQRPRPRHRSRRERMAAEGLLLQLDGSRHDWLEGRGPWLTLVGAIDDATGQGPRGDLPGPGGQRRPSRGPTEPGAPAELSQVGRALVELGIGSIVARSPQAKGRIERLWGTFRRRPIIPGGESPRAPSSISSD